MQATPARRRPTCRARLVLLRPGPEGEEVLLVHHRRPERSFWCFPGGGVEPGETLAAAARREAREEVGLSPELEGVVYLQDRPGADALDVFFLARVPAGAAATLGADPERTGAAAVLAAVRWIPLARLGELDVLPPGLAAGLATGRQGTWGRLPEPESAEA